MHIHVSILIAYLSLYKSTNTFQKIQEIDIASKVLSCSFINLGRFFLIINLCNNFIDNTVEVIFDEYN